MSRPITPNSDDFARYSPTSIEVSSNPATPRSYRFEESSLHSCNASPVPNLPTPRSGDYPSPRTPINWEEDENALGNVTMKFRNLKLQRSLESFLGETKRLYDMHFHLTREGNELMEKAQRRAQALEQMQGKINNLITRYQSLNNYNEEIFSGIKELVQAAVEDSAEIGRLIEQAKEKWRVADERYESYLEAYNQALQDKRDWNKQAQRFNKVTKVSKVIIKGLSYATRAALNALGIPLI